MCAMIPMFLNLSKLIAAITRDLNRSYMSYRSYTTYSCWLKPVMSKRLVRLGHAVDVVLLLHRSAAAVHRIEQFADESVFHRLFAAVAGVRDDPADCQRVAAVTANLEWHLVGRTADTAGFDLEG